MSKVMFTVSEVAEMIKAGKVLTVAGVEKLLSQLPAGRWIGGTTPYFMTEEGGLVSEDKLYVKEIPAYALDAKTVVYTADTIKNLYNDAYDHGFSVMIIPQRSHFWLDFFGNAMNVDGFAMKPLAGWVSMVRYEDQATKKAAVFCNDGKALYEEAVVLHVKLPENKVTDISSINPYIKGDGDIIEVEADTQSEITDVLVNGKKMKFLDYLNAHPGLEVLPLVTDYSGISVNVSFTVNHDNGVITCYAPVFKDVKYQISKPVGDSLCEISSKYEDYPEGDRVFACACGSILRDGNLYGKRGAALVGPFTGGEICYQMLNHTNVAIDVFDVN